MCNRVPLGIDQEELWKSSVCLSKLKVSSIITTLVPFDLGIMCIVHCVFAGLD